VFYDGVIAAFKDAGVSPRVVQEAAPMSTVIGLVSAGIGAGLVTEGLFAINREGVSFAEVKESLPQLPIAIAWRRNSENALIKNFVDCI